MYIIGLDVAYLQAWKDPGLGIDSEMQHSEYPRDGYSSIDLIII